MLARAVAFAAGAAVNAQREALLPLLLGLGLTLAPVLVAGLRRVPGRAAAAARAWPRTATTVVLLAWLLAGLGWATLRAQLTLHAAGLDPHARVEVEVGGCVQGIPRRGLAATYFELAAERLAGRTPLLHPRLRLAWYGRSPELRPGDCLALRVRIAPPHGLLNPGGFDRAGWLFRRGIAWQGYVRTRLDAPQPDMPVSRRGGGTLDRARLALAARIHAVLGTHPAGGLVRALAVGLRDGIDEAQWQVLRSTGTAHLVAVSGLHIGLVATVAFALVAPLWCRCPALAQRLAAPRAAALAALLGALGYAALAGFSMPTRRALVMAVVVLGALFLRRRLAPGAALGSALLAVLVLEPGAVLDPGAWLSFTAVAVLLHGARTTPPRGALAAVLRVQWVAALGLLPLLLAVFGEAPLLGVLANAVAVPLTGVLIVPLVLGGAALALVAPALAAWPLLAAATLLEWLLGALGLLAGVVPPLQLAGAVTPLALGCAMLGVALLLAPAPWPGRWTGTLWLLPLLLAQPSTPVHGQAEVTVLDVGQGLAVVLRTAAHTLVYDTGPTLGQGTAAWHAVLPFLRHIGVRRIDTLMVSHPDSDHAAGTRTLLEAMPVTRLLGDPGEPALGATPCRTGMTWRWDGVDFAVLHPPPGWRGGDNDRSCVLRVRAGRHALLLPGDLEARGEARVLASGQALRADVLVAGHHGSKSSSAPAFVRAVSPVQVLFAAGRANRWGFPHAEVVARFASGGARAWSTARHGALRSVLGGDAEPGVHTHAASARRFWHRLAAGPWQVHPVPRPVAGSP